MAREITAHQNPAERMRDKINLHRAVPLAIGDGLANRVIGELLDGRRARGIIHIFHLVARIGERVFHLRHRTARAAEAVEQNDFLRRAEGR